MTAAAIPEASSSDGSRPTSDGSSARAAARSPDPANSPMRPRHPAQLPSGGHSPGDHGGGAGREAGSRSHRRAGQRIGRAVQPAIGPQHMLSPLHGAPETGHRVDIGRGLADEPVQQQPAGCSQATLPQPDQRTALHAVGSAPDNTIRLGARPRPRRPDTRPARSSNPTATSDRRNAPAPLLAGPYDGDRIGGGAGSRHAAGRQRLDLGLGGRDRCVHRRARIKRHRYLHHEVDRARPRRHGRCRRVGRPGRMADPDRRVHGHPLELASLPPAQVRPR